MAIAAEVRRVLSKNPRRIKILDFLFKFDTASASAEEKPPPGPQTRKWATQIAMARHLARMPVGKKHLQPIRVEITAEEAERRRTEAALREEG